VERKPGKAPLVRGGEFFSTKIEFTRKEHWTSRKDLLSSGVSRRMWLSVVMALGYIIAAEVF